MFLLEVRLVTTKVEKVCYILEVVVLITVRRYCGSYQDIGTHFIFFRSSLVGKMTSTYKAEKDKSCESFEEERRESLRWPERIS